MANEDQEQWHLPLPLRMSNPKVAREAAEFQKLWKLRAHSPFARLSPQESLINRAIARIPHLQQALAAVEQELQQPQGRYSGQRLRQAKQGLLTRLAENFAIVGRFDMAAQLDPRPAHQQEYRKKAPTKPSPHY